ncbi:MAG: hypothetical protein MJZ53_01835 [Paludibacteraceae bacterium]|nr:hypothetical protein [Paludibacteraceae bacterium]
MLDISRTNADEPVINEQNKNTPAKIIMEDSTILQRGFLRKYSRIINGTNVNRKIDNIVGIIGQLSKKNIYREKITPKTKNNMRLVFMDNGFPI